MGTQSGCRLPLFSVAPMMGCTDNHFRTLARLVTRHTWLYTEMVVADTIIHQQNNLDKFLYFPESHHPIVLQIGGNDIPTLAKATRLAMAYGYDEINLNCGCPSEKVAGRGCFGACLMFDPKLVGHAMAAIAENCNVPVSVKCRIGVDKADSYKELCTFVETVSTLSPTRHFIIHARKAILKGLRPSGNRNIPPLKYGYVFSLIRDFPHLKFSLNGGISTLPQAKAALKMGAHGVMLGRAAYNSPWSILSRVDAEIYGGLSLSITRREMLHVYKEYADSMIGKYGPGKPGLRQVVKPLLGLFAGEEGTGAWRKAIDKSYYDTSCMSCSDVLSRTLFIIPDPVLDAFPPSEVVEDDYLFPERSTWPDKSLPCQDLDLNSNSLFPSKLEIATVGCG